MNSKEFIELFHLVFCRFLEKKVNKTLFTLKGGCNFRFFFKSIRYSEDIDFDIQKISVDTLKKNVNNILASQEFQNALLIKKLELISFSTPKQTDTTQRWKVQISEYGHSIPLPTKIEFSRRGMKSDFILGPIEQELILKYQLYPIFLQHYNCTGAFNQKIQALINRSETQARDVFDLYWLITQNKIERVKTQKNAENLTLAIDNCMNISYAQFKSQVVAYLDSEHSKDFSSPNTWDQIQETVIHAIENYK